MNGGYMGRVLLVDLSDQTQRCIALGPRMQRELIGGKGLAVGLCHQLAPAREPALAAVMPLVVAPGPLAGLPGALSANRFAVAAKSPLGGTLSVSSCGGDFGFSLKRAGYDALVVVGKARRPTVLVIGEGGAAFEDGRSLWGQGIAAASAALPARTGQLVIGPAGENQVRFAAIASGQRYAGRGGLGAVMGSKNLKAVVASGGRRTEVAHPELLHRLGRELTELLRSRPITGRHLPGYGTAEDLEKASARGALLTKNGQRASFTGAGRVSGIFLRQHFEVRNCGCTACAIHCTQKVRHGGRLVKGPEFQTAGLLGPFIENADLAAILEYQELCDDLGLDALSTGNLLGFAMELEEKGLWRCGLRFGSPDGVREAIRATAHRQGIGADLAEGTWRLSQQHGGQSFALQVKGLEMAAYDPRAGYGQGLEYATCNRGACHLGASTIVPERTGIFTMSPYRLGGKARYLRLLQDFMGFLNSTGFCSFTLLSGATDQGIAAAERRWLYRRYIGWRMPGRGPLFAQRPSLYDRILAAVTGAERSRAEYLEVGERIFTLERLFNLAAGLGAGDDSLPERLLAEDTPENPGRRVPLPRLLAEYYRERQWNQQGVPAPELLRRLGLSM